MNILEIIKRLKDIEKLAKEKDVAKILGLSEQDYNNRKRSETIAYAIFDFALNKQINLEWLFRGKEPPSPGPVNLKLEIKDGWTKRFYEIEGGKQVENYIPIPVLSDAAAGGSPREIKDNDVSSCAVIYKTWCRNPDNYTCAKMVGDSMSPILENDSIVAINHSIRDPKVLNNKIVAFRKNGGVTIKWLRITEGGIIIATPENKFSKEFYSFREEEIDRAIIGKIEWWWGRQK